MRRIAFVCICLIGLAACEAQAYPARGTLMVAAASWCQGLGVDVYSNGGDHPYISTDKNFVGSEYTGVKWQCVELAHRLYYVRGWKPGGSWGITNAYEIWGKAGALGMQQKPKGSGYIPVPGDMMVFDSTMPYSKAGHVAIVDRVSGSTVYVCEQNASENGGYSYNLGSLPSYCYGFVHDPDNPLVNCSPPGDPNLGGPGNGAWYPLGTDITFYAYNNGGTSPETRIWVDGGPDWGWGNYEGQHWGAPGSGTYTWHGQKHNAAGYSNVVTWSFHINYPPNSPSLSSPADGAILASRSIPLSWNGASDPDGGPGAVRYCVNRNNWGGETGWIGTGTSTSLTAPSDGTFTWQVKAADDWNESGYSGTRSFTVDTVAPSVSTAIVPASPNGNAGWYVTKPSFSVSASDVTTHVAHTWYVLDGASPVSYSTPVLLNDGIHTYSGRADDDAANVGVSATSTAKVDTLAPVVSVIASPSSPNGENGWYTVQPTIAVSAVDPNGSNGSGVSNRFYSIDGTEQPYTSEVTIPLGAHAVTGRATDVAGNSATVPIEIDVDTTAPAFVSMDTPETSGSLDTLTASWEFADPESDIAEYEYSIYREAGETDEFVAGPFITDQPHAYQTNLSLVRGETYYFIVRAKNYAGTYSAYVPSDGILATEETRDVAPSMNSGGVSAEPRTSENYLVLDSFGQFVVDTSTSANFTLESGYWHSEVTTTPVETIAIAKATENNKLVQLGSAAKPVVVTVAPGVFADRFYVEQPDRSSGIAVSFGTGLTSSLIPGDRVWILGTLNESGGERIIEDAAPSFVLHSDPLGALFVTNGWLGGSDLNSLTKGIYGAAGLNNIGLLVRTCGRVQQVDASGAYFYISDGSNIADGTLTNGEANVGVRVAADGRSYTGQFVTVTGVSSCFIDEGGRSQRLIRPVTIAPLQ